MTVTEAERPAPHEVRFPNETDAYRQARDALLRSEIALRRQIEAVAAQRRALPAGGEIPEDYIFAEATPNGGAHNVKLSQLFGDKDTLVAYSFMFGPAMKNACPSCTAMLDSLDGTAEHAGQRVSLVVIAKSPIARIMDYGRERGWRRLRLLSSADNTYNRDYRAEGESGNQLPALNVFVRRNGRIFHTYCSELLYARSEPGEDPRHVDPIWPLWNLFDFTPDGRGADWYPRLRYGSDA